MLVRTALVAMLLAATPIKVAGDKATVIQASSAQGQDTALALSNGSVLFQDVKRRWHRFRIAGPPTVVRFARLDDGAGLAAWESDGSVFVRLWRRSGKLEPAKAVLNGVQAWTLGADRHGTVVLAGVGPGESVYATIRDPGGTFGVQEQLQAPQPPSIYALPLILSVAPIAGDGTVTVSWGSGHAKRGGGETLFDPPAAGPGLPVLGPTRIAVDDAGPVRIGRSLRALCGCTDVRLFNWSAAGVLAVNHGGAWYIAKRSHGVYDHPRLVNRDGGSFPVWTSKPGVLAFTRTPASGGIYLTR